MSTPGLGGGGSSVNALSSTAGVGGGIATAVVIPQTGILPVTGTKMSLLLLVSVCLAVAIAASMVAAKLSKRAV